MHHQWQQLHYEFIMLQQKLRKWDMRSGSNPNPPFMHHQWQQLHYEFIMLQQKLRKRDMRFGAVQQGASAWAQRLPVGKARVRGRL
jgi:hypothetical protein